MRRLLCLLCAALLSGCAAAPQRLPDMAFDHFRKVELAVSAIEVRNDYRPPMTYPHVEHLFQTPPYVAAENLLKSRLVSAGGGNVLRAVIEDASVVREELPVTREIESLFMRKPAGRLRARILLRFELASPRAPDIVTAHAEIAARRTRTLPEGTSVAERDTAYFDLTEALMADLNKGLQTVVRDTFGIRQ